jgi:hypothetical protein
MPQPDRGPRFSSSTKKPFAAKAVVVHPHNGTTLRTRLWDVLAQGYEQSPELACPRPPVVGTRAAGQHGTLHQGVPHCRFEGSWCT